MSHHKHHDHHAVDVATTNVHIITVSDSRSASDDKSGNLMAELLTGGGYVVAGRALVKDEPEQIKAAILSAVDGGARAVLLTGGTGLSPRDGTPEVVSALLDKPLPGFGELFRSLSFAEIGAGAMLSRAVAGSKGNAFIACLPGSTAAVRLGMEKLLLPQLRHIVGLLG